MKTAKDFLDEAHAAVPKISTEDGIAKHRAGGSVFVDVRDPGSIAETGTIAGAVRAPRGTIETTGSPPSGSNSTGRRCAAMRPSKRWTTSLRICTVWALIRFTSPTT